MLDQQIRLKAFNWLEERSIYNNQIFTRNELEKGFQFENHRITLVGPKGIWKPKIMELALSISTTSNSPYNDSHSDDGFLDYKYRGTDPNHPDNVGLRKIMKQKIPLIYFYSFVPGEYYATWPIFIQQDFQEELSFKVSIDDINYLNQGKFEESSSAYARRKYLTTSVKSRMHQRSFREKVLRAYASRCALCLLKHRELLDAAHIVPDSHELGSPIVQNGLSLCKIHHAALDSNIIGISPDYSIHVRSDILDEIDGPMLKHGIQSLNNKPMILPKHKADWPDRDRLDFRFKMFKEAS